MIGFVRTHWRLLNIAIKLALVMAFGWFVAKRFAGHEDMAGLWEAFLNNLTSGPSMLLLLTACALMPFNWLTETLKWTTLLKPVTLPWRRALAGILSGVTLSLFTPNRIGEYGGRILYVPPADRWRAVLASLIGSLAQNMVYVTFGLLAGVCFLSHSGYLPPLTGRGVWVLVTLTVGVFGLLYFHLPALAGMVSRRKPPAFLARPWEALHYLSAMGSRQLGQALLFSVVRYGIFSLQYVLLLSFFGVEVSLPWLIAGVAVIYLVQTSIPLPPLLDMVARNEIGMVLWVGMGANELSIAAAGLAIWVLNLAFPALVGLVAIGIVNVPRTFGYDSTFQPTGPFESAPGILDGSAQASRGLR